MKKLLFICLGNICRSPAGEGIMQKMLLDAEMSEQFECDSAGTVGHHSGSRADARMLFHAKKRDYDLISRSRKFNPKTDFDQFDYIFTMDNYNYDEIIAMDREGNYQNKIHKIIKFCKTTSFIEVPDPYYGGDRGFQRVLDILEDACSGILEKLKQNKL